MTNWLRRPMVWSCALLALLAFLPALTAAPGRMPSDSKLYLYLDPAGFMGDAASSFDALQFAGWVPHQHIAYLWPSGPWYVLFDLLSMPDWIAHRLWLGSVLLAAGLGVRWLGRLLGLGPTAALLAGLAYQLSPYVLPYVSRTSVLLLPWAGLGWIVAFTVRATRRGGWADPAAIALIVLTVGGVNATALAMIIPAPVLWLVHTTWMRETTPVATLLVAGRVALLSTLVSLWWIVMLLTQARFGTDVLPYSESLGDVSLTSTAPEVWRSLGYWLFYVRDPYAAATTESLRYLSSSVSILLSFAVPVVALTALVFTRWRHRRFAALLIAAGLVLAIGVHPSDDRSPLMRILTGNGDDGLALALRSSTRALPVAVLGLGLAVGAGVEAMRHWQVRRWSGSRVVGGLVAALLIANLPALWTGGFVDPALERDQDPPEAWLDAATRLDEQRSGGRVLQLPGAEFGAFRWGYTVDQPLPGLTDTPLVTRDLLPLGSGAAMDLLYALDDRIQTDTLDAAALKPIGALLGADTVWLANDLAFDRFRTARPEVVRDHVLAAADGDIVPFGPAQPNLPDVPMVDERTLGDPRVGLPMPTVELASLDNDATVIRAGGPVLLVAGSGDGLVDAAAAGLIAPDRAITRYTADLHGDDLDGAMALVVTDSNRDRARHWRSSQDVTGFTEEGGPADGVLRPVAADARLELFESDDPATQTTAQQRGPVRASATSYGEPFAYLPEHRAAAAVDGDRSTAWLVGEHGDPLGEMIRLEYESTVDRIVLHQPTTGAERRIVEVRYVLDGDDDRSGVISLTESSWDGTGQAVELEAFDRIDLTITAVAGGIPFTGSAVAAVGFAEVETALGPSREVVQMPSRALGAWPTDQPLAVVMTRLRTDPLDRWRDDPEPRLERSFSLDTGRDVVVDAVARLDRRATDAVLAPLFGWEAVASTRLTGSPRNAGVSAIDGSPDTAWITGFGAAQGAVLSTTGAEPVSVVAIRQPAVGTSRVTEITVRTPTDTRVVPLVPDGDTGATGSIDPPLPPGPIEFELSGITSVLTSDRRFGDPVELPAIISELVFDGRPSARRVDDRPFVVDDCVPLATVDGVTVSATVAAPASSWLDGAPLRTTVCEETLALDPGEHVVSAVEPPIPLTLDRLTFDAGVRDALDGVDDAAGPRARVTDQSRFERTVDIDGCPDGCWLVLGEGYNVGWSASVDGEDLGDPVLVDGGFNGWWVAPGDSARTVAVRWTAQSGLNWALFVSGLSVLACAALVVLGLRRSRRADAEPPPADPATAPTLHRAGRLTARQCLIGTGLLVTASTLLIGVEWSVIALAVGAAVIWWRHERSFELIAAATVAAIGLAVVVRERRSAPPPDGAWPSAFESLHGLGVFAIVCVLVAALISDDDAHYAP